MRRQTEMMLSCYISPSLPEAALLTYSHLQVFHCLNEILELCHNFCSLVSQTVVSLDDRGTAQLDLLVKVANTHLFFPLSDPVKRFL